MTGWAREEAERIMANVCLVTANYANDGSGKRTAYKTRDELRSEIESALLAAERRAKEETFDACIKAVAAPPPELYPDKSTPEQRIEAAKQMGAVGACGYFHERGLITAMGWHIKAIEAIRSTLPAGETKG